MYARSLERACPGVMSPTPENDALIVAEGLKVVRSDGTMPELLKWASIKAMSSDVCAVASVSTERAAAVRKNMARNSSQRETVEGRGERQEVGGGEE